MFSKKKRQPDVGRRIRSPQPTSQRAAVFSYHTNRSARMGATARDVTEPQKEALRRGPRFRWLKQLPTLTVLLLIVVITAFSLQLSSKAKVVPVGAVEGEVFLRDLKVYEEAANKAFAPLLNRNKLTVDATKITTDLQKQFPELKVVSVSLSIFSNQPVVYIQPATPKLILVAQGGMYVLDGNGRALITGNQVLKLEELQIPVVSDESGVPIEVGKVALPTKAVAFVEEIVGQLRAKDIKISSLTLPPGTNELHVRMEGVGYFVKFNIHGNAREEAGTFIAVKEQLASSKKIPKEYVDVRVENKAYYK